MGRRRAAGDVIEATPSCTVLRDPARPSGRLLRQAGMDASYVDLADPRHLEFHYLRRLRDVVEAAGARHVLHIGGAGCALPRALAAAHPDHRQEVVELDPHVLDVARRRLGLRRAPGLKVRLGEGRAALAERADGSVDAVVVDAFAGAAVPPQLASAEACAELARVARRAAAINVIDAKPLATAAAVAAGLAAAFAHVLAIGAPAVVAKRRGGNVVLVGAHAPLRLDALRARAAADPEPASVLEDVAPFIGGAPPWRDADRAVTS